MARLKDKVLPVLISLTLLSLPLYIIRCKYLPFCVSPIPFTLLEVLILGTFFVWLLIKFREKKNLRKIIREISERIPRLLQILVLIFIFAAAINILISPNKLDALGIFKAYFIEPLLLSLVVFDFLARTKNFRLIIWSLVGSGVWVSLFAIWEKLTNHSYFNPGEFMARDRVSSVFSTSNAVGLLIIPLIIILTSYLFYLYFEKKQTNWNFYSGILALSLLLFGQTVSGSRGGYLALFFGLVFFFGIILYKKQEASIRKWVLRGFIFLSSVFIFLNIIFFLNISVFLNSENSFVRKLENRLCLWEGTVNLVKERPIFGAGLAGYENLNLKYRTCSTEEQLYPHNLFLNFWVEIGLVGTLAFVSICVFLFRKLLEKDKISYLKIGLASVFIAIFFHGLVDVPYFKNDLATGFWVIVAVSLALINEEMFFKVRRLHHR